MSECLSAALRDTGMALARRARQVAEGKAEPLGSAELVDLALALLTGAQRARVLEMLGLIPVERPPARLPADIRSRLVVHEGGRAS